MNLLLKITTGNINTICHKDIKILCMFFETKFMLFRVSFNLPIYTFTEFTENGHHPKNKMVPIPLSNPNLYKKLLEAV